MADEIAAAHADAVTAISELKDELPDPLVAAPCGETSDTVVEHVPGSAEDQLNGTYRFNLSNEESRDFGMPEDWIYNNAGVQTYDLDDGTITYQLDPSERAVAPNDTYEGTYEVDGDVVTFRFPALDNEVDTLRFEVAPDGDLHMTLLATNGEFDGLEFVFASKVWDKIG